MLGAAVVLGESHERVRVQYFALVILVRFSELALRLLLLLLLMMLLDSLVNCSSLVILDGQNDRANLRRGNRSLV